MTSTQKAELIISSEAFEHNGLIPARYTCQGKEINPPLKIDNIPAAAKSLAIIAEDPDAPKGTFDHWVVWNIAVTNSISENTDAGLNGLNGSGKTGYHGPCPPSGTHRYYFKIFALDKMLDLQAGADKIALQEAIKMHVLAEGELMGRYKKNTEAG